MRRMLAPRCGPIRRCIGVVPTNYEVVSTCNPSAWEVTQLLGGAAQTYAIRFHCALFVERCATALKCGASEHFQGVLVLHDHRIECWPKSDRNTSEIAQIWSNPCRCWPQTRLQSPTFSDHGPNLDDARPNSDEIAEWWLSVANIWPKFWPISAEMVALGLNSSHTMANCNPNSVEIAQRRSKSDQSRSTLCKSQTISPEDGHTT